MAQPIRVAITGAAGQIAYSLIYMVSNGNVFGPDQPVILHLLEVPEAMGTLKGVVMEITDCAFPLVRGVVPTSNPNVAFKDVSAAFLVGASRRNLGMQRKDLLSANTKIFKVQGEAINRFARKDIKILVVGNPANTNALICSMYAPSIPKENFSAMTRLDHNRAQAQIADKLRVPVGTISNVIIWGNHSSTQYPDANHSLINKNGIEFRAIEEIDNNWAKGEFLETVAERGAAVIAARKMSSAMSAAKAAADHMRDWFLGTQPGKFVSMGVMSDGSYGAPKDVIFSYPVTTKDKKWTIVQGLRNDEFSKRMIRSTGDELLEEKETALSILRSKL